MVSRIVLLLMILVPPAAQGQTASGTASGAARVPATRLQSGATGTFSGGATADKKEDKTAEATAGAPATPMAADTEAQQKANARLQKIQQLQFDRRPSTILRVWGKPADDSSASTKGQPAEPGAEPPPEPDPFDQQLQQLQKDVTLGNWPEVKRQIAALEAKEAKAAYARLLLSLRQAPELRNMDPVQMAQMQLVRGQMQQYFESHNISFPDLLGIAAATPEPLDRTTLRSLAQLLVVSLRAGNVLDEFAQLVRQELAKPESERALTERQVAILLTEANETAHAGDFLPTLAEAESAGDHEALNLLARHALALHAKERKVEHLEQAWQVLQAVLVSKEVKAEDKDEALKRAVEIAPKIREELGKAWLEESFTQRPERGMEILATIGSGASQSLQTHPADIEYRLGGLQLQTTAAEALIASAPERAVEWSQALTLLAGNWLTEAQFSYRHDRSTSMGPSMRRDIYGNLFFANEDEFPGMRSGPQFQGQAIKVSELIEIKPSAEWIAHIDSGLRPKFDMILAQLYLKLGEEDLAFPRIEQLAQSYPEQAKTLVDEFLTVWTRNHDPNAVRNRTNYYMYMYGFERKAESIPLTRSKQQRNLEELADLVKRLNALPIGELNNELLVRAFTTCHSAAEVYRLDAIQAVFGSIASLKPETIAELSQQMRANLAGVWRQPDVQQQNKTNRKQKDIEVEVLRGYEVASAVVDDALAKHPGNWRLELARAALSHDENTYQKELAPSSKFSERQQEALARFARAAELYAQEAAGLKTDEQSTRVYELWLYASLGACDPQFIDETRVPDVRQPALIREAILALSGETAEHHMSMFANTLFTRLSAIRPNAKYRYLKAGFEVVGDHKQAQEARKVFDYYHDLVSEIKLEAAIDGDDRVGSERPFGVFVNLRHTREIERESGGFGRYLQNQNNQQYSYNYGRPTENYRDKFEEIVRQAMQEHFEVLSVTFQSEDVNSRAVPNEYGWRITPYAYLLLKARSPAADKLPPLRLDLDFLDTSGYAVLPIESPAVPLDAASMPGEPRPFRQLEITQILDERQATDGKLVLEIKVTARGLVPELEQLVDVKNELFEVVSVDDQGLSVSRFDPDASENLIVAERNWMIIYQARPDLPQRPTSFAFARSLLDEATLTYQRYDDADLASAESVVELGARYGRTSTRWLWLTSAAVVVGLGLLVGFVAIRRAPSGSVADEAFPLPDRIDAFTVLGLLQRIRDARAVGEPQRPSLEADMLAIEQYFFVEHNGEPGPDLKAIAQRWSQAARA